MADLGTVSLLIDIKGQPLVKELATDFDRVTVSEKKVSDATAKVMADFQRMKSIMQMVKTDTDSAANSFQRFSVKELQQAAQRMQGFEAVLANTRRGMGQMGMATQQIGYQVGDFLVQVQSGTNWMVAFGQQATQLVGILPSFAGRLGMSVSSLIGISTGLGIAIPLITAIGAAFMRTSDSAKKSAEGIDIYSESIKNLTSEIQKNQDAFLKAKFDTDILGVASASQQIEDFQNRIVSLQASIDRMKSQGGKAAAFAGLVTGSVEELEAQKKALQDLLDKLQAQAEAQRMLNGNLSVAGGLQRAAVLAKQEELRALKQGDAIVRQFLSTYLDIGKAVENISKIDIKSVFSDAVSPSGAVYQFVKNTYDTMSKMVGMAAASQRTDYYKLETLNEGMVGRAGGKGQGQKRDYSLPETVTTSDLGGGTTKLDPLVELQKQIALQEELNGKTEAEIKVRQALGEDFSKYSPMVIKGLEDQIQKQIELEERLKEQQQVFDVVKSSMEDAFMGMVDGTKSAKDAFKSMAAAIIKELYNVLVVQQMVGSFNASTGTGSGIVGAIASGLSGAFGGGSGYVKGMAGRANGGPISAGVPYMVGERGPELIIPKSSGTVLTNGQTKAALGGSSNESYVVNNNISVTGSDSAMVRQEIAKMIPQISSATKAAMIDAKRRGGQMASAFR